MITNIDNIKISISESSLISEVEWRENRKRPTADPKGDLIITFISKERKYEYIGVPFSVLNDFVLAESMGKYFHSNIKDKYTTYEEV